jgi:nucleoside-diphosphate-sugar epimerase
MLIAAARNNGFAAYVGGGQNRWPAVHTLDAACLYRLAVESAPPGSRLHATDDEGVPMRSIVEEIARGLGLSTKSVSGDQAAGLLGAFVGGFTQVDNPTSSARTRELLRWHPSRPKLLRDLAEGHCFASTKQGEGAS